MVEPAWIAAARAITHSGNHEAPGDMAWSLARNAKRKEGSDALHWLEPGPGQAYSKFHQHARAGSVASARKLLGDGDRERPSQLPACTPRRAH